MRFHFVMLLIVVLVSLSMHSMASAAQRTGHALACASVGMEPQAASDRREAGLRVVTAPRGGA